jgi:hypothetical protein
VQVFTDCGGISEADHMFTSIACRPLGRYTNQKKHSVCSEKRLSNVKSLVPGVCVSRGMLEDAAMLTYLPARCDSDALDLQEHDEARFERSKCKIMK